MSEQNVKTEELKKLDIPSFKVDSKKYRTPMLSFRNGKMVLQLEDIQNLQEPIIDEPGLMTLSVQFPFKMPYGTALKGNGKYITIKDIIDTVRETYRHLYRNLTSFPCELEQEGTFDDIYELTYALSSLHVEGVYYCPKRKVVKIDTKGNPKVRKGPNLPF